MDAADLFVLASAQSETLTLDDYAGILFPGTERKIPCLCINPDFEKLVGGGQLLVQAQLRGFTLVWEGRCNGLVSPTGRFMNRHVSNGPILHQSVFCASETALRMILLGGALGFKVALVQTGIHDNLSREELLSLCHSEATEPDFMLPSFSL